MKIEQLQSGPRLNGIIALNVMGWTKQWCRDIGGEIANCDIWFDPQGVWHYEPYDFSGKVNAAWLVVEKMVGKGIEYYLSYTPHHEWPNEAQERPANERFDFGLCEVPGTDMCWTSMRAVTAELAICLCVLKAHGITEVPDEE